MGKDTDTVTALREARDRRDHHDRGAADARVEIEKLILRRLREEPDTDRDELAAEAGVSGTKVRDIAKANGIPPRKRGGPGRRIVKPAE